MPKVILISGGSDGLGKAIAKKLAPNNQVVILAHNKVKLEATAKELNCDFIEAELTDYRSLESAIDTVVKKYHQIDVLVNNAGIWMEGELEENEPQKIKEIVDVNTTGTIFLTKAVLPGMHSKKNGQIINIISQDGLCAKKSRSVYHASKWAITGFTKCLQEDLEDDNIKVTGVYPGLIKTNLFEKNGIERDLTDALDPAEVASVIEYVINLSPSTHIPEIVIKNKKQISTNMDNTNTPTIDLNIDPDMITPNGGTPQTKPNTMPISAPTPPIKTPGIIDITPGSTDTFPPTSISNHIDIVPLAEPKVINITPEVNSSDSLPHLSDITSEPIINIIPEPTTLPTPVTPPPMSSMVPPSTSLSPMPAIEESVEFQTPIDATPSANPPVTQSSPLAEDPDLVKLIK